MGNPHPVYWSRFHGSRRSARHSPDSLEVRAGRQQLGRPGQRSSATPTRSANENERSLRFQTLCRTLADVAKRPSSVSSRGDSEARMPEEQAARVTHRAVAAMKISRVPPPLI